MSRMGSMGKQARNVIIRDAFKSSQDSISIHPKLVKKLREFYDKTDQDRFFDDFIWYLRLPISGITEKSAYVDRTLGRKSCRFSFLYSYKIILQNSVPSSPAVSLRKKKGKTRTKGKMET